MIWRESIICKREEVIRCEGDNCEEGASGGRCLIIRGNWMQVALDWPIVSQGGWALSRGFTADGG